jgi:phosphoribosyl-ATP pyrophosphohydrolase
VKILDPDYVDFLLRITKHFQQAGVMPGDQIIKVGEEYGEVCETYTRWMKLNPRKTEPATAGDVARELADVAVTAMVAIIHLGFDPDDFLKEQQEKTEKRFL